MRKVFITAAAISALAGATALAADQPTTMTNPPATAANTPR